MNSTSGLSGHIERIRRYAKQHYANNYFDIIPVMLLAAQMSREAEHQEHKDELFKASRIQDFLDAIRVSLVEHGVIRRSQTLLGSTVGAIEDPDKWVTEQLETYQNLTQNLKNMRDKFQEGITKASRDNHEYLIQQIKTVFKDVFDTIQPFAEENWNADENQLKFKWENRLRVLKFQDKLNHIFEESSRKFNHEVEEILEEIGTELQIVAKLGSGSFKLNEQDRIIFKDMLRIGGNLLGIAGAVAMFFAPPVGIFLGIAGTVLSVISNFLKSKEQKRREAVENIRSSLNNQLEEYEQKTLTKAEEEFSRYCDTIAANINNYFDKLIQSIEKLSKQLAKTKSQLDSSANYLNRAYAKRIIDWCIDKYEVLNDENIIKAIGKVERNFGRSITIKAKSELKLKKPQETINRILQEDVYIILPEISSK